MTEWISVNDKLPTSGELVLVSSMDLLTNKHGWFYLARYTDYFDGIKFSEKRWFTKGCLLGRVTHWMPLPSKPNY